MTAAGVEFIETQSAPVLDEAVEAIEPAPRRARWRVIARRIWPWTGPALLAIAYFWFALSHLAEHRYQINPDGVGYISVAQKYLRGEWADAVNAYWSPLYSWLMVPVLAVGTEPVLASKITGIFIGAGVLAAMWRLLKHVGARVDVRLIGGLAAIPLVVDAVYYVITPDLLLGGAIVLYLAGMINPAGTNRWTGGVRIGALAGLAYLAKAYALPFVIAHFLLVRCVQLIRPGVPGRRWGLVCSSACTLLTLSIIVGAWSAALSHKYGYFTTGSTGDYNMRVDGPHSHGQVMHWAGYLPPPNPTAISAWEDITYYVDRTPGWSLRDPEHRPFLRQKIERNYQALLEDLQRHTTWLYPLLAAALLLPLSRADLRPTRPGLVLAAAILIYPCGYLLLHIEGRFLTPLVLLLLLAGLYVIVRASARGLLSGWWRRCLAAALLGCTFISHPMESLKQSRNSGVTLAQWADSLRGVLPAGATIASDTQWGNSLYLAFYLDWRYYGEPAPRQSHRDIQEDLERLGVEYFLLWHRRFNWPARAGWEEIAAEIDKPFRIYRRPQAGTAAN